MNPLLYGIYQLLKLIVRPTLRIFYPYKVYIHPERLRFDYPAILVSNHPNTLIDPLTVAAKTKKLVFFLANSGLFKSKFGNWFFNTFYCIPVQRPQDIGGRQPVSNEESFSRANEHLTKGGVLYIAPEGASEMERRLRPLKTGTARIALSTEKKNNYQLGMAIIPVGLTYYNPQQCGSRMVVQVGEPIFPKNYQLAYENDPVQASRQLTDDLENQLAGLIVNTRDEKEDQRLRMLEAIVQNERPLTSADRFKREMELLRQMRSKADDALGSMLDHYRLLLKTDGLSDGVVSKEREGSYPLTGLLALPVYAYGLVNNLLPGRIPVWISNKLNLYKGYDSTVKILTALISIPLFYWLQTSLVASWLGPVMAWLYLLSLPLSAIVVWRYGRWWRNLEISRRFQRLEDAKKQQLRQLRNEINRRWSG